MGYFPLFIDLSGVPVLVVGGGHIAARRVQALLDFGADVTVVAPDILPQIQRLCDHSFSAGDETGKEKRQPHKEEVLDGSGRKGRLMLCRRPFILSDADGMRIVLAATDDPAVNGQVVEAGRAVGALCNRADKKEECDFYFPSIVGRCGVTVGICSGGASPSTTKGVRMQIEDVLRSMETGSMETYKK